MHFIYNNLVRIVMLSLHLAYMQLLSVTASDRQTKYLSVIYIKPMNYYKNTGR